MADQKHGDGDQQPPIIVIKRITHGAHHGGAWKVAYADFVTSMMSLFIVLWIVGQNQDVKKAVAGYFRDPGAFSHTARATLLDGASVLPNAGSGLLQGQEPTPEALHEAQKQELERAAEKVRESLAVMPDFKTLEGQIEIKMTEQGLNIQMLEKTNSLFFDVGSANLSASAREVLGVLASQLSGLPNRLAIEGHTDSRPYPPGADYTNWELSADRANSARRYMLDKGLHGAQVAEVRGFADTRLRNPAEPTDVTNRRISITVLYPNAAAASGGGGAPTGAAAATAGPPAPFMMPAAGSLGGGH